jgi:hypothetical protein
MIRFKTWIMGLTAVAVAGAAWAAPVNGVEQGSGQTRLAACREALSDVARASDGAAESARRELDNRSVLVSAEVSACDCEEVPATTSAQQHWVCLATWRLVAMPERR